MIEQIKNWLRGDYNSIRHRFVRLPLEWLSYALKYRLRGKTWVDFYAARLDHAQNLSRAEPLAEAYKRQGQLHLDFMKAHGLKPHHALLDYGCGVCRSGIFFAKYLRPSRYTGIDISGERLARGQSLLDEAGVGSGTYRLIKVQDCQMHELEGQTFDYVFANSVLTHMPEQDIRVMLKAMRPLLSEAGQFYFSYAEGDERKRRNIKDFWYRRDEMRAMCEEAGYTFRVLEDWPNKGDIMALASIRAGRS